MTAIRHASLPALVAGERTKLMRHPVLRIALVVLVVLNVLLIVGLALLAQRAEDVEELSEVFDVSLFPALSGALQFVALDSRALPLLLIVLVGAVAGGDHSWRTLHLLAAHGAPRGGVVAAKFLAACAPAAAVVLVSLAGAFVWVGVSAALGDDVSLGLADADAFVQVLAGAVLAQAPYVAATLLVALVTRSAVVTVALGFAAVLVVEPLLVPLGSFDVLPAPDWIVAAAPSQLAAAMVGSSGQDALHPAVAAAVTTAMSAVLLLGSWAVLRRQDLT